MNLDLSKAKRLELDSKVESFKSKLVNELNENKHLLEDFVSLSRNITVGDIYFERANIENVFEITSIDSDNFKVTGKNKETGLTVHLNMEDICLFEKNKLTETSREVSLNIFDHLKDPSSEVPAKIILHILKIIPELANTLIYELNDKLIEDGILKFENRKSVNTLLADIKRVKFSKDIIVSENEESSDIFTGDIVDKIFGMIVEYFTMMMNLNDPENLDQYENETLKKGQFIGTLTKGQIFTFLDTGDFNEFTFIGNREFKVDGELQIVSDYCKINTTGLHTGTVTLTEFNVYRPVLVTDPTEVCKLKLNNILKEAYQNGWNDCLRSF